jgi:hypothetical protein
VGGGLHDVSSGLLNEFEGGFFGDSDEVLNLSFSLFNMEHFRQGWLNRLDFLSFLEEFQTIQVGFRNFLNYFDLITFIEVGVLPLRLSGGHICLC